MTSPQPPISRRRFLEIGAGLSAAAVASAAPAEGRPARPARLSDIDHVVILMQENRSFDHVLANHQAHLPEPQMPADQRMPQQEKGRRRRPSGPVH